MKRQLRAAAMLWGLSLVGCAGKHAAAPAAPKADTAAKVQAAETEAEDPFRWMETASLDAWLHREGDAARRVFDALPERARFAQMIGALNADRPSVPMMS